MTEDERRADIAVWKTWSVVCPITVIVTAIAAPTMNREGRILVLAGAFAVSATVVFLVTKIAFAFYRKDP